VQEVSDALEISSRPARSLLTLRIGLGLVRFQSKRWRTAPRISVAFFDFLLIPNHSLLLFENVKQAVLTNSPQAYGGGDIFKTHSMMSVIRMELTIS
jgi:hypothetical protein